jgi:hypothetical protein
VRLHERTLPVARALNELTGFLLDHQQKHGLTDAELLRWHAQQIAAIAKYEVRHERHGDADKKGDEA